MPVDTKCILKEGGIYVQRNHLRGRIIAMYGTVQNFAKAIKWSNRKAYEVVNGKQEPSAKDIDATIKRLSFTLAEALNMTFEKA